MTAAQPKAPRGRGGAAKAGCPYTAGTTNGIKGPAGFGLSIEQEGDREAILCHDSHLKHQMQVVQCGQEDNQRQKASGGRGNVGGGRLVGHTSLFKCDDLYPACALM